MFPNRETVESIRRSYPIGARVELVHMDDPYTRLTHGSRGRVQAVDDAGTIFVSWDNGEGLGVVYGHDRIRLIEETEEP